MRTKPSFSIGKKQGVQMMEVFIIGSIIFALLLSWMVFEAHSSRVVKYDAELEGLPEAFCGKKIFFISDIHRRKISSMLYDDLRACDWIIIGGDLLERGVPRERIGKNLRRLKEFGPLFFVFGNNDYDMPKKELLSLLEQENVEVLDNRSTRIQDGESALYFTGVDDCAAGTPDIRKALKEVDGCTVLIVHNPDYAYRLKDEQLSGLSLILSGHTHGGQIRLGPFGIRQKGGWYSLKGVPLLISNGYGATHIPLRLCAPSQTHLITLSRKVYTDKDIRYTHFK
jgi:predicted MPP superfamily phosphohydrolase